jgi:hypothetical protein
MSHALDICEVFCVYFNFVIIRFSAFSVYNFDHLCGLFIIMVVQGTRHQGNIRECAMSGFGGGGTQCTIIALAALILAGNILSPSEWTVNTIDNILQAGDYLYSYTVDTYFGGNHSRHVGHDHIPSVNHIHGAIYSTRSLSTLSGITGQHGRDDFSTSSIEEALPHSLALSNLILATFGDESVGIIRHNTQVYVFDSHARDTYGNPDPDGTAVLLTFHGIDDLLLHISRRYAGRHFELSSMEIYKYTSHGIEHHSNTATAPTVSSSHHGIENHSNTATAPTVSSSHLRDDTYSTTVLPRIKKPRIRRCRPRAPLLNDDVQSVYTECSDSSTNQTHESLYLRNHTYSSDDTLPKPKRRGSHNPNHMSLSIENQMHIFQLSYCNL